MWGDFTKLQRKNISLASFEISRKKYLTSPPPDIFKNYSVVFFYLYNPCLLYEQYSTRKLHQVEQAYSCSAQTVEQPVISDWNPQFLKQLSMLNKV